MHRAASLAGLVLLLASSAAAAQATPASDAPPGADSFRFAHAEGRAHDVVLDQQGDLAVGEAWLRLAADGVHAETDWARRMVLDGATSVGTDPGGTVRADYGPSVWTASSMGGLTGLFAHGGAELEFVAAGGTVTLPSEPCRPQPMYFTRERPPACPDLGEALALGVAAEGPLVLRGDFTLALWSWAGIVEHAGAQQRFWAGESPTGAALGLESELRHVLLEVRGGVLELHLPPGGTALFASSVRLDGLRGPGDVPLAPLELSREPGGVAAAAVAATGPAPGRSFAWLAVPAVALVAAPVLVLAGACRARGHLSAAYTNLGLGNLHAAARHARRARRHPGLRKDAGAVGAVAMIRAGRMQAAEEFVASRRSPADAATLYLQAHILAQDGRSAAAQDLLDACLRKAPHYRTEATRNPVLAPLVDPGMWP